MAEHEETQQEKEIRWTAQRAAHDQHQQAYQAARTRRIGRNWLIVGAIVLIVAVIAVVVLR
jgi:Flp pilus assembly protein TadB